MPLFLYDKNEQNKQINSPVKNVSTGSVKV